MHLWNSASIILIHEASFPDSLGINPPPLWGESEVVLTAHQSIPGKCCGDWGNCWRCSSCFTTSPPHKISATFSAQGFRGLQVIPRFWAGLDQAASKIVHYFCCFVVCVHGPEGVRGISQWHSPISILCLLSLPLCCWWSSQGLPLRVGSKLCRSRCDTTKAKRTLILFYFILLQTCFAQEHHLLALHCWEQS